MEQGVADSEVAIALSEVDVAQATLEDAKAQFAYEQVLLEHHVLTAPYDEEAQEAKRVRRPPRSPRAGCFVGIGAEAEA